MPPSATDPRPAGQPAASAAPGVPVVPGGVPGGVPGVASAALGPTADLNVTGVRSLITPRQVRQQVDTDAQVVRQAMATVLHARQTVQRLLQGQDPRLLLVIGPCSIHDPQAALEYAHRLHELAQQVQDRLVVVMRVYFEKPRTTVGWKGLINDPHLDGTFAMEEGLCLARSLFLQINALGLPTGTEMLDPITPQYLADLVAWAAIGARTIESQTHREMASGLSMPVGYKNGTSGDLQIAIDAMIAARAAHAFLGIDMDGHTALVQTRGNPWGHLILRGSKAGPNDDPKTLALAAQALEQARLLPGIMVDCSHANAAKKFQNQERVWRQAVAQRTAGNRHMLGLMVESHLQEGNQPFPQPVSQLRYGVSITDPCLGWEKTAELIRWTHGQLA